MDTVTQQDHSKIIIAEAILTAQTVDDFYFLHEQTRLKTGKNLRQKSIKDIHALIFNETMMGAWTPENQLIGMMSARKIRPDEYAQVVALLIDKDPKFKRTHASHAVEFNSCAVRENACQSSIASQLIQYSMTRAKEKGAKYGLAKVWAENAGGQRVFGKAGFTHVANTKRDDSTPLLVFAREL